MAILNAVISAVMNILPNIPGLPLFVGQSLNFMGEIMVSGAGMVRYMLGDAVYLAALDYIVVTNGIKVFMTVISFIKKWILLR